MSGSYLFNFRRTPRAGQTFPLSSLSSAKARGRTGLNNQSHCPASAGAKEPTNPEPHLSLSRFYAEQSQYEEAKAEAHEANDLTFMYDSYCQFRDGGAAREAGPHTNVRNYAVQ